MSFARSCFSDANKHPFISAGCGVSSQTWLLPLLWGHRVGVLSGLPSQTELLSRCPGWVGPQAMLHDWKGSLMDSLSGQGFRLCPSNQQATCWALLLGGMVEWAPWLDGTASWALRLLRVIVLHCFTGYTRPEAMLNSWAQLLAWLPAQVVLRMCSPAPGHLCPCFL